MVCTQSTDEETEPWRVSKVPVVRGSVVLASGERQLGLKDTCTELPGAVRPGPKDTVSPVRFLAPASPLGGQTSFLLSPDVVLPAALGQSPSESPVQGSARQSGMLSKDLQSDSCGHQRVWTAGEGAEPGGQVPCPHPPSLLLSCSVHTPCFEPLRSPQSCEALRLWCRGDESPVPVLSDA